MSHLDSGVVGKMDLRMRALASFYRLGWGLPPGSSTWDSAVVDFWDDLVRWFLYPFLEPSVLPDGPFTVYCVAGPYTGTVATFTQIANASAAMTGLSRNSGESDFDLLGRALQTEPIS